MKSELPVLKINSTQKPSLDDIRTIADAMPQLVWSAKPDGTVDYFNKQWIAYTGVTVEDMQGDAVKGVVHPDELTKTWECWNAAIATGQPYEIEYRLRNAADGSYRWFLGRGVPVFDANSAVARWIGTATDIDDQKRTRDSLALIVEVGKLLSESTAPFQHFEAIAQLITAEMADICIIATLEGKALRIEAATHRNPAMEQPLAKLRGQRVLHPEAERALIDRIATREPFIRKNIALDELNALIWPYLVPDVETLNPTSVIMVPLHSRETTYGALFVYYADAHRSYCKGDFSIFAEIANRVSLAIETAKTLERERKIAQTLQQASLPTLIPELKGLHLDAVYAPAGVESAIGGDWYDAIELDDGSVVLGVGDVTGRGLEAAVIMSKVRHAMGVVPRHDSDPARILDSAEWFLRKRYPNAIVTAFVAVISADRTTIRYASAGHPFPLLRRNDKLGELESVGLPLGLRHLAEPQTSKQQSLEPGDLLVLYTDGLVEWGKNWNEGSEYLQRILKSEAIRITNKPAKLIATGCIPTASHDDVAILTVSLKEPAPWSFVVENAQAAEHVRGEFVEQLRLHAGDPALIHAAELIFGELIGNVVRHAPGPVEIYLDWSEDGAIVHVIDAGPPFEPDGTLPSNMLSECGRGLFIIQQISPSLQVERIEGYGNHVSVTLPIRRRENA